MDSFFQDVRAALRGFARNKSVALAAFLALSVGIGANTAVFSVVQAVLLAPLPYPDGDRLVTLRSINTATGDRSPVAPPVYEALRTQARSFSAIASSRDGA